MNINHQNGFTLIEIMVVIVIIAILASVAIPSYRQYVIRNAESEAQAKMKQLEIELNAWRATALTYKGFRPKKFASTGIITYAYDANDNKTIYVPANSNDSTYKYMIQLVDGDNAANSLIKSSGTITSANLTAGRAWKMLATPNPNKFNDAHKILLMSNGTECKTKNNDSTITIASQNCGSYSEKW